MKCLSMSEELEIEDIVYNLLVVKKCREKWEIDELIDQIVSCCEIAAEDYMEEVKNV